MSTVEVHTVDEHFQVYPFGGVHPLVHVGWKALAVPECMTLPSGLSAGGKFIKCPQWCGFGPPLCRTPAKAMLRAPCPAGQKKRACGRLEEIATESPPKHACIVCHDPSALTGASLSMFALSQP
eukprot:CAMPEP_0179223910 /NCGR_PEP_ID=MMETSP0797-20121207/7500_1 /TAXON_ID=47934 /ORGANISM="Dinophysis acuminata, Strain DAEP01" /LENGTH=123 /DNA_ID=CAMNT_0020930839 /DNA_START=123 /DNA_END=494 /DNA_ORIENTATION=-